MRSNVTLSARVESEVDNSTQYVQQIYCFVSSGVIKKGELKDLRTNNTRTQKETTEHTNIRGHNTRTQGLFVHLQ